MSLVKIDTTPLSQVIKKKSIDIKPVGTLTDLAQDIQIEILEDFPQDDDTLLEFRKRDRKTVRDVKDFIKKVLKLTNKEMTAINDTIESSVVMQFGDYVSLMLQGSNFESFEDYMHQGEEKEAEDAQSDPKSLGSKDTD